MITFVSFNLINYSCKSYHKVITIYSDLFLCNHIKDKITIENHSRLGNLDKFLVFIFKGYRIGLYYKLMQHFLF